MAAPDAVLELLERFARNREQYLNPAYNETQVRREFLDPFFTALGWDVDNTHGYAQAYKDVVHEDAIKVGLDTRAPDYSFRIGGQRKFFVEAKKPSTNLKDDPLPAYQLRRYGWSGKLPLSILTDFQEFAVYDCRVKPAASDKPSTARTLYVSFEQYDERWDEIAGVFGKEAILQGSFDRYAESTKAKKGTAEVDKAFLGEIELWRDALARSIALRNPSLSQRELNYAVQATIDRLIFLRICEDRGIEPYGRLQGLCNGGATYGRLKALFYEADQRYNSGLFHFEEEKGRAGYADQLTLGLAIDDKPLKDILKRLYYPESPYEFSVLPADILGQVYEQFLGKVIRLTAGHRAVVEDKPEVKKAGGVYYTPTYIVDYIVKHTVGRLLEGKTPKQAASLSILDPACGSGSFLIGAFQYLLDWHRDWYAADAQGSAKKHAKALYQGRGGEWRLTTAEKKRILQSCIYGVDIDAQAVETTKLSLLLKVLEGETSESIDAQLSFLRERALPDLSANIKCGNSLIAPDFYDDQQLGLAGLDEEERYRVNVFDWEAEFAEVLGKTVPEEKRGFDAVIGNPPYINMLQLDKSQHGDVKPYWKRVFRTAAGAFDIYILFMERGLALARPGGLLSFIVPNKFLAAEYAVKFRGWLLESSEWVSLLDCSRSRVWPVAVYPVVPVLRRCSSGEPEGHDIEVYATTRPSIDDVVTLEPVPRRLLETVPDHIWSFMTQVGANVLWKVLADSVPLDSVAEVCGATTVAEGSEYPGLLRETVNGVVEADECRFVVSGSVKRYATTWLDRPVQFTHEKYQMPAIRLREPMPPRRVLQARTPKIMISKVALRPQCFEDALGDYAGAYTTYVFERALPLGALVAVLNSSLMAFVFRVLYDALAMGGGYLRFQPPQMRRLPIPATLTNAATSAVSVTRLTKLASQSASLRDAACGARTPGDHDSLRRQVGALDAEIDRLVYELYGLTDDEIALVESSFEGV